MHSPLRGVHLVLILAACLMLPGCASDDASDLQDYVHNIKSRKKGKVPPLPTLASYKNFAYSAQGRDPFVPMSVAQANRASKASGLRPNLNRPRELLEQFPLDTLRMVGSLEQEGHRWGLIQTEQGTIHRVRRGKYIGQNNGRIIRVTETQLELREIISDHLGGYIKRQTILSTNQ